MMMMKNRKGISPVIATVILVAVAITVAIAVSYWMSGITSSYTKFEKVEIQTATCTNAATGWTVTLSLKNTGTNIATVMNVFVNDVEATNGVLGATTLTTDILATGKTIASGETQVVHVYVGNARVGYSLSSGTSINIKLHSAGGMDYIKLVELV
jgi:archaeal type IV pilus assembly protein PilA